MKNSKPINTLTAHIVERLVTDHAPIHYRKAIRAAKPYISFIYIDTDTFPTVTNIPLVRPSLCTRFIDDATRQPELHVLYRNASRRDYDGQTSIIQAFTLNTQTSCIEVTIPIEERHVFLDAALNPEDQREKSVVHFRALDDQAASVEITIPIEEQHVSLDAGFNPEDQREKSVVQFRARDAQASSVEKPISCTTLRPSLAITFNPRDQRERLTLQSLKPDVRAGSVEKTISTVEQKASLDAILYLAKKFEEIAIAPYILDSKPAQYTNTTLREGQYDSYNHSLAIIEPHRYDYPISKTRTRSRIVQYHRYSRTSHVASSNTGIDFKS